MLNLAITCLMLQLQAQTTQITLQQAVENRLVVVTAEANPSGTHYQQPLVIRIKNVSPKQQMILVENGHTFLPLDTSYQPIIIVRKVMVTLSPGETKEIKPDAMCFNKNKSGPAELAQYRTAGPVGPLLTKLTAFLEEKNCEAYASQLAIWSLMNGEPLRSIAGWNPYATNDLVNYVAEVTDREPPPPPDEDDYERNLHATPKSTIGGNFEFTLLETTEIHIALFNEDNIVVRELYFNPSEKPGAHVFSYEFDATVYTDPVYYVRYLENNVVLMELKVDS